MDEELICHLFARIQRLEEAIVALHDRMSQAEPIVRQIDSMCFHQNRWISHTPDSLEKRVEYMMGDPARPR
jgi:hypothetical protein